jgi:hypothetical protein
MEKLKVYTHEEMLDRVIGEKGTPAREKYETDINNFLIGEVLNKQEKPKILLRNN